MILNIAFCISVVFIILSIAFIFNQINIIENIKSKKNDLLMFRKKILVLDCVVFVLSIIFFCIVYFREVDGYMLQGDKTMVLLAVLFLIIMIFSLFNIVFLLYNKRKKIYKADNNIQLIAMFIIYCLIIFLMVMSNKYCKMIAVLMWTNYFYGYVLMYMLVFIKICFCVAITPAVYFISNYIIKKFIKNK